MLHLHVHEVPGADESETGQDRGSRGLWGGAWVALVQSVQSISLG